MGYVQSTSDPCIYTSAEGETSIIGVYVDDFVIAAETTEKIKEIKTAQEAVWMRELISDLRNPPATSTEILEDNQSAVSMAKSPQFHGRTKHINIKYHFIREQIANGTICLKYCPTEDMLADLLTKGIGAEKFERLRMSYGMCKQES